MQITFRYDYLCGIRIHQGIRIELCILVIALFFICCCYMFYDLKLKSYTKNSTNKYKRSPRDGCIVLG